jgi:hypothetical protein
MGEFKRGILTLLILVGALILLDYRAKAEHVAPRGTSRPPS